MPFDAVETRFVCATTAPAPARMAFGPPYCDTCNRPTPGKAIGDMCPFMSVLDPASPCPGHVKADFIPDSSS
jgi:hypothetical protein